MSKPTSPPPDDDPEETENADPYATHPVRPGDMLDPEATVPQLPSAPGDEEEPSGLPTPGARIRYGDYELIRMIGRGGMGVVHEAWDIQLKRYVALKLIKAGDSASQGDIERFLVEARAVAKLHTHPNIVKIYRVGQKGGEHYLAMQLVRGGSLKERLAESGPSPRTAAAQMIQVADAIGYAHQQGILHLDLKPDNVLLDEKGSAYVTDFGLAKRVEPSQAGDETLRAPVLPRPRSRDDKPSGSAASGSSRSEVGGEILGTPSYMSPEQALGQTKDISTLSDVYGLGSTLFAALTGRPPFEGPTVARVLANVVSMPPPSPRSVNHQVDRDLDAICLMALAKDPADRYESARALARDLGRWLKGEPVRARKISRLERAVRWVRREPMKASAIAATTTALLFLIGGTIYTWRAQTERTLRQAREDLRMASAEQEKRDADAKAEIARREKMFADEKTAIANASAAQTLAYARESMSELVAACERALGGDVSKQGLLKDILEIDLKYFQKVVERAQDDAKTDSALRLELARAYRVMADLERKIGGERLQNAVADHFTKSLAILGSLRGQNGTVAEPAARDYGDGHHEFGIFLSERGKIDEALEHYEAGRAAREALCGICPKPNHGGRACGCVGDPGVRTELGRSYGYMGDIYVAQGNLEAAEAAYRRSHEIRKTLHEDRKDDANRIIQFGRSFGNLARLDRSRGDLKGAIEEREVNGLPLLFPLLKMTNGFSPQERYNVREDLVNGYDEVARFQLEAEAPKRALDALDKAANLYPELQKCPLPPAFAAGRPWLTCAAAETTRAEAILALGEPAKAEDACRSAEALMKGAKDIRTTVNYRRTEGRLKAIQGRIASRDPKKTGEAVESLNAALNLFELLVKDDDNIDHRSERAEIRAELARLEHDPQGMARAVAEHEEVVEKQKDNHVFQVRLARARAAMR